VVQATGSTNPLLLPPTYSHHALVALERKGHLKYWVQQNHDGLAQKAGFPFSRLNEIHGSWFDKSNPVVQMDGILRKDLLHQMLIWREATDLVLAMGTSLSGMNADSCASESANRFREGLGEGLVIVSIQRTPMDEVSTLRIYARTDDVMRQLAVAMKMFVNTKENHTPWRYGAGRIKPAEPTI